MFKLTQIIKSTLSHFELFLFTQFLFPNILLESIGLDNFFGIHTKYLNLYH